MQKKPSVDKHVREKRDELVWAIQAQGYTYSQMAFIFGAPRPSIQRIISRKPSGWHPKWVKVQ